MKSSAKTFGYRMVDDNLSEPFIQGHRSRPKLSEKPQSALSLD